MLRSVTLGVALAVLTAACAVFTEPVPAGTVPVAARITNNTAQEMPLSVVLHEAVHVRQFLDGRDGHGPECQKEAENYAGLLARAGVAKAIADSATADAARSRIASRRRDPDRQ